MDTKQLEQVAYLFCCPGYRVSMYQIAKHFVGQEQSFGRTQQEDQGKREGREPLILSVPIPV